MRVWRLDIGVGEAEIRGWPDGPVIYARARQGHPAVAVEVWEFIVDTLNEKEQREAMKDQRVRVCDCTDSEPHIHASEIGEQFMWPSGKPLR